jgi:hypothetical protein
MFEKLFGKVSDVVYHKIGPYVVERERFLEHCCEQGFGKRSLERIAGVLLTAATDLQAHGGLDVDQRDSRQQRLESRRSALGRASAAALAITAASFSASRVAGFDSSGICRARRPAPGRMQLCSTTSTDG